ncbi:efflux RND transporter periplasmic adaptor subunit [Opitutus terrae]|uniref:Efflux transporter, RND family, MFP subunit n=1 Tax=Opitutus terrae (strain DSM 11246 / JCM 15787 / PB90-1) TaxID=452637 RepID=B1ZSP0_OPITP|nr:efflux RND transporter periplasmic adaptor subunit [Opitutus terrae]ACB74739.1 efflux transporter, RND family, MFP subunit [Opitutus terrae PB90-1]
MNSARLPRFILPAALVLALVGCGKHEPAAATAPDLPAAKVQLATARIQTAPALVEITGTVRPVQRATLAAKVMGAIEELPVSLGQKVQAGDVLAQIGAGEISARLLQAKSQLNVARRDLDRERDLLGKGASTADMVKGLEDRLAMTEAMVREAEVMLGYATLRAPFDGVIARKLVNVGDLAAPGVPLLEVEGTGSFQVEAAVPDSLVAPLLVGQQLEVAVPSIGASFQGLVTEISSAADAAAHSVLVKLAVPQEATVRSGQFARVQVPGAPVKSLLVPATAVSTFGQLERVFVRGTDGRAGLRLVKSGATHGDRVEILSGLDDGEEVVVAAPAGLREGQPLEVVQ